MQIIRNKFVLLAAAFVVTCAQSRHAVAEYLFASNNNNGSTSIMQFDATTGALISSNFAWRSPVGAPVRRSSGLANRFR